jgi:hypothetical protein
LGYVRAEYDADAGGGLTAVTFSTSADGQSWSVLGTETRFTVGSLFGGPAAMEIGSRNSGGSDRLTGSVLSVVHTIAGTIVADPDFTRGTIGKDGAGNVWTINGSDAGYVDAQGEPVTVQGSYVDETVGRRAFTWDAGNGRWQMTYGSTGYQRMENANLSNGWIVPNTSVAVVLVRVGNTVSLVGGITGSDATSQTFLDLPVGYRPSYRSSYVGTAAPLNSDALRNISWELAQWPTYLRMSTDTATGSVYTNLTWQTQEVWPTELIGTMVSSIPSGFAEKAATGAIPVDEIEDAETGTADIETKPKPKPKPRKGRK